jgi:hypothetical protein
MSVLGIDGAMAQGNATNFISAVPRHIGLHIPDDEIIVSKLFFDARGHGIGIFAIRAETKKTRLHVDWTLTARTLLHFVDAARLCWTCAEFAVP